MQLLVESLLKAKIYNPPTSNINMLLYTGRLQELFSWGSLGLDLPEFSWLVTCSIVANHYFFQCRKAILFGYICVVGAKQCFQQFLK